MSLYVGIKNGGTFKAIFKQMVRECDLSEDIADNLLGDKSGKYINRGAFAITTDGSILVEVPINTNFIDIMKNYIDNDLPPGLQNKVNYYTVDEATKLIRSDE